MIKKSIILNVILIIVFCVAGFILFTENVRTVQIVGLFACGAVFGASLTNTITIFKTKQTRE